MSQALFPEHPPMEPLPGEAAVPADAPRPAARTTGKSRSSKAPVARVVAATASAAAFAAVVTGFAAHEAAAARQKSANASNASTSNAGTSASGSSGSVGSSGSSGSSLGQGTFGGYDDGGRFGDDSSIYTGRPPSSSFGSGASSAVPGRGFLSPSAGTSSHGS